MAKKVKANLEFLLVKAEVKGIPEKGLLWSRNIVQVDLIWPRTGVAGKITNVTRLRDLCVDDARQRLHLEPGLGTHFGSHIAGRIAGVDWRTTFQEHWEPNKEESG